MDRIAMLVLMCALVGCATPQGESQALPTIHPKVFSMVECWLSDREDPVVTEINLNAVRQNGNQFPGKVFSDGEWTRVDSEDGRGWMCYRLLSRQGDSYTVEFQSNGGGTLTTSTTIRFTLSDRAVSVDGKRKRIQTMRIDSMGRNIQQDKSSVRGKPRR